MRDIVRVACPITPLGFDRALWVPPTGGNVNWAFGIDKIGFPHWVDLSETVRNWADATSKTAPPPRPWPLADDVLPLFEARFVEGINAMELSGSTNAVCNSELCGKSISELEILGISESDYPWQCCLANYGSKEGSLESALLGVAGPVSALAFQHSATLGVCGDLLGGVVLEATVEGAMMNSFASALATTLGFTQNDGCKGGCPFLSPLCKAGRCVKVSCDDMKTACNENSETGMQARLMCSKTCGCGSLHDEALLYHGKDFGCNQHCLSEFEQKLAHRACTDFPPGSADLTDYATSKTMATRMLPLNMSADVWSALGCRAVDFLDIYMGEFCDLSGGMAATGLKSFRAFCPVACKCTAGDPNCPGLCPSEPFPRPCTDLSPAQLQAVNTIMDQVQGRPPYTEYLPRLSCATATATVCSVLNRRYNDTDPLAVFKNYDDTGPLPAIYHPCPATCNFCRHMMMT